MVAPSTTSVKLAICWELFSFVEILKAIIELIHRKKKLPASEAIHKPDHLFSSSMLAVLIHVCTLGQP